MGLAAAEAAAPARDTIAIARIEHWGGPVEGQALFQGIMEVEHLSFRYIRHDWCLMIVMIAWDQIIKRP